MIKGTPSPSGTPGSSSSTSGDAAAPTQPKSSASFNALPNELRQRIGTHLQRRDHLNFAMASKGNHAALAPQLQSLRLAAEARAVTDLAGFLNVLGPKMAGAGRAGNTKGLPASLQSGPLVALAPRIVVLPLHQQPAAIQVWRNAATALAAENPAVQAELDGQDKSTRMADRVAHLNDLARFRALIGDVSASGEGVQDSIASLAPHHRVKPLTALASRIPILPTSEQFCAIRLLLDAISDIPDEYRVHIGRLGEFVDDSDDMESLNSVACFYAVKSGESVDDALNRAGISDDPAARFVLTQVAWGVAVRNGEPIEHAAARYGITDPGHLQAAKRVMALEDLAAGDSIQTVIARYEVTNAVDVAEVRVVAMLVANAEIEKGHTAQEAAARFGITDADRIAELAQAAFVHAQDHVLAGGPVEETAERFGITDADQIAALKDLAVQSMLHAMGSQLALMSARERY